MHNNQELERYRRLRIRLTKFWFLLLVFNIFLQFDAVENLLNGHKVETGRFVVAELECSSHISFDKNKPEKQIVVHFSFPVGLSNRADRFSSASNATELDALVLQGSLIGHNLKESVFHSRDPSQSSGLSPPKFS